MSKGIREWWKSRAPSGIRNRLISLLHKQHHPTIKIHHEHKGIWNRQTHNRVNKILKYGIYVWIKNNVRKVCRYLEGTVHKFSFYWGINFTKMAFLGKVEFLRRRKMLKSSNCGTKSFNTWHTPCWSRRPTLNFVQTLPTNESSNLVGFVEKSNWDFLLQQR